MRVNLLVSDNAFKGAVVALAFAGVVAASCTFNPGPAGSAPSTGSTTTGSTTGTGYGGSGILGGAGHSGYGGTGVTSTGAAGAGNTPTPDGVNCGLQQYGLQNVPPDLLIVEDKSGSMGNQEDDSKCPGMGAPCVTKWADTTGAINMVVAQTETTIRWGLKYFANDGGCTVNPGAAIPIAPNNAAAIAASIAMTNPGGSTPTAAAVMSGVAYLQTVADPNPKFILLATDGEPNCAGGRGQTSDQAGAVAAVTAAAAAGFPVFVVGVGNVATAQATLDMLAVAGGKPQAGMPKYYPATSSADLVAVLKTIGGMIASCSFGLGQVPPDPASVGVYANGDTAMKIPKDTTHVNGWDYGAGMKSIVLYGAACDNVKSMTTKTIQAIFGCPGVPIP